MAVTSTHRYGPVKGGDARGAGQAAASRSDPAAQWSHRGGKCAAGQSRPTQGQPTGSATHPRSALSCGSRTVVRVIRPPSFGVYAAVRHPTRMHLLAQRGRRVDHEVPQHAMQHLIHLDVGGHGTDAAPGPAAERNPGETGWPVPDVAPRIDRLRIGEHVATAVQLQDAHQDRISLRDHPFAEFERRRVDVTAGEIDDGAGALHLEDGRPPVLVAVGGSLGNQCGHHVRMAAWTSMPPSRVGCVICTLYPFLRKNSPTRQFVGTFWGSAERLCWYEACGATENANSCMHRAFWRVAGLHEPICANGGGCTCGRRSGATATGRRADDHGRRRSDTGVDV